WIVNKPGRTTDGAPGLPLLLWRKGQISWIWDRFSTPRGQKKRYFSHLLLKHFVWGIFADRKYLRCGMPISRPVLKKPPIHYIISSHTQIEKGAGRFRVSAFPTKESLSQWWPRRTSQCPVPAAVAAGEPHPAWRWRCDSSPEP